MSAPSDGRTGAFREHHDKVNEIWQDFSSSEGTSKNKVAGI